MKAGFLLIMLFVMAVQTTFSQPKAREPSRLDTDSDLSLPGSLSSGITQDAQITAPQLFLGKPLRARGPLVGILKPKGLLELPRRMLQYFNPFAPVEHRDQMAESSAGLSTRARTTMVGLHVGGSAFPDAATHEPTLTLL